jgi:hypothetical protein
MKSLRKIDVGSAALYGAVLFALWTFVVGFVYWVLGWLFGSASWFIDMNIWNWTTYSFATLLAVVWQSLINGVIGAIGGLIVAVVYNIVAGVTGGLKLDLE